jgi:hypothetical protein
MSSASSPCDYDDSMSFLAPDGTWRPIPKKEAVALKEHFLAKTRKRQLEEEKEINSLSAMKNPVPRKTTARMTCLPHRKINARLSTPRKPASCPSFPKPVPRMTAVLCPSPEPLHKNLTNPASSSEDDSDDGPLTKKKNASQKSIVREEKMKALTNAFKASRRQNIAARRALPYTPARVAPVRAVPVHVPSHDCILEGLGTFFANRQPPAPE